MGILAHVDAGKTSLTERLLYAAGVVDRIGRVDDGSTRTDSMDLERRRGITIRSAVVAFELAGVPVNLIDTPGHPDFIAEVERALAVLDGAVLVISAVEGVQAQTRVLMRTLTRLRIPVLLFVNKIDRVGARYDELLGDIRRLLTPTAVPMGTVSELGSRGARYQPFPLRNQLLGEVLAERDDAFLARYLDETATNDDYRRQLGLAVAAAAVQPVYFGSAMTGEGVPELIEGIRDWLPRATGSTGAPLGAEVFKVERGAAGQKIASARIFSGTLAVRRPVEVHRGTGTYQARPTAIEVYERGATRSVERAGAGQIVAVRGVKEIQVGDRLGEPPERSRQLFAPPTLETVVSAGDRVRLFQALQQLAEQDPLIQVRKADQLTIKLYGEVQKEVIAALLESEYGLTVSFSETRPIHLERPTGTGAVVREMGAPGNYWVAGVGFRVSPAEPGAGLVYRLEVELGGLPRAFHTAIEETVEHTLGEGLSGWPVTDCRVDLIHTGYDSVGTTAADFRRLVPPILLQALDEAGTEVLEPVNRFELEVPADAVSRVLGRLAESAALVEETQVGPDQAKLTGVIPAGRVHTFETQLPGLSHGEGILLTTFEAYQPVPGTPPTRPRTDGNPLNLNEYLVHLSQV